MIPIDEFYAKLEPKQKILFVAALIFLVLALMDRLVLGPIIAQLKVCDNQIWAKQESMRRNLRIISFKDRILKEYSRYELYLDSGDKSQEEIVSALLRMIETLARQNEITISNVQPGDVVENPLYKEYLTNIDCEGKVKNVLTFMDALEASDFLFRILKYSFASKSKTGEAIKASIDISRILIQEEKIPGYERRQPNEEPPQGSDAGLNPVPVVTESETAAPQMNVRGEVSP
jgi:hypothetical protein